METAKVKTVTMTMTPVDDNENIVNNNVQTDDDLLNKFSNTPLTEDPDKVKEAKGKLQKFIEYFKSESFVKDVNRYAYKTGEAPRVVAKNTIAKAFGIVGDLLGIAVSTVSCTLHGLIDLLQSVLHSAVDLITRVVNGLCRIVTFNQTNCCNA